MNLDDILNNEELRHHEFPVTTRGVFMAHAGVAPLPRAAVDAIHRFTEAGSPDSQESPTVWSRLEKVRGVAGRLLGCRPQEVALLGPTSLGLNLIANGLSWEKGDEVVFYPDDYPANVYPWTNLASQGVRPVRVQPERPGEITWDVVEAALTPRTRLVALASCHFLSGYRVDVDTIGRNLRARGILFCVDGIQSVGAGPFTVEHIDFLSADSHKWMLGPVAAGVVYVRGELQKQLQPTLLGAWNVVSPEFIAQEDIRFEAGARRYEPGTLNVPGLFGMAASIELLLDVGIDEVRSRNVAIRCRLLELLQPLGFSVYPEQNMQPPRANAACSGIVSLTHPSADLAAVMNRLTEERISASLRQDRDGTSLLRFSPHFYNTDEEVARVAEVLAGSV